MESNYIIILWFYCTYSVLKVSHIDGACCVDSSNHCGKALPPSCGSLTLSSDALYICAEESDPVFFRECPNGCRTKQEGNDVCVDNSPSSHLLPKSGLEKGKSLYSPDKKTKLSLLPSGDLVLSTLNDDLSEKPVWSSGTASLIDPPVSVNLLASGELVMISDVGGVISWRSGTAGPRYRGATLWVRNGGVMCLSQQLNGTCLWSPTVMIAEQTTYAPFTTTTLTTTKTTPEKATATPSTTLSSTSVAAHQQRPQENLGCPGCPLYNGGNCYECCNRLGRVGGTCSGAFWMTCFCTGN